MSIFYFNVIDEKSIRISYERYECYASNEFIKNNLPVIYMNNDEIIDLERNIFSDQNYINFMTYLSKQSWTKTDSVMTAKLVVNEIKLTLKSDRQQLTDLKQNIHDFMNPLFDKDDCYHDMLLETVKEITDDRVIVMANGKKYKIELVELI